jgi:hypothetical protein
MAQDISLHCSCGAFQAVIHAPGPSTDNHGICYCVDCQAFPRHLGQAERCLDAAGGTDLYQTQPSKVEITAGAEHLAVLRLAPNGLYRWHTRCCNTPIGNTMGSPKLSFVGFLTCNFVEAELPPIAFRYKKEQALSPVDGPSGSLAAFAFKTMKNMLRARLSGRWKQTPFFDAETGRAVSKPYTLSEAERVTAYL